MSITIDGSVYRTLEEQVRDNQLNIANIIEGNEILGKFGIKIIGQVSTADDLPDASTYLGEYGDAYLVGSSEPYDYYIFTRAFEGETSAKWFNLGPFPVPGPTGPQGMTGLSAYQLAQQNGFVGSLQDWLISLNGERGPAGASAYQVAVQNGFSGTAEQWLDSLIGPQGPQGPQGIKGANGENAYAITLKAELDSVDQLPTPSQSIRNDAYLVNINNDLHVYAIIENDSGELVWTDIGGYAGGTDVTVGGIIQQNWNADTKMNVLNNTSSYTCYVSYAGKSKNYTLQPGSTSAIKNTTSVAIRKSSGCLEVSQPQSDNDAVNKGYADDVYYQKPSTGIPESDLSASVQSKLNSGGGGSSSSSPWEVLYYRDQQYSQDNYYFSLSEFGAKTIIIDITYYDGGNAYIQDNDNGSILWESLLNSSTAQIRDTSQVIITNNNGTYTIACPPKCNTTTIDNFALFYNKCAFNIIKVA